MKQRRGLYPGKHRTRHASAPPTPYHQRVSLPERRQRDAEQSEGSLETPTLVSGTVSCTSAGCKDGVRVCVCVHVCWCLVSPTRARVCLCLLVVFLYHSLKQWDKFAGHAPSSAADGAFSVTEQTAFNTPVPPLPNASAANHFTAFSQSTISLCS